MAQYAVLPDSDNHCCKYDIFVFTLLIIRKSKPGYHGLEDFEIATRFSHYQISLRPPEPTSLARAQAFNKPQVENYFRKLEKVLEDNQIDKTMNFNIDEFALTTIYQSIRQKGEITIAERGVHTTVVVCMSSRGMFVPSAIIFPHNKKNDLLYDAALLGILELYSESGYMTGLFLKWFRHFVVCVRPTENKTALLILDGHLSHKYFEALQLAKENNVILTKAI